jgi:phage regulator Rha-like protein
MLPIISGQETLTMSSREIAQLTNSEHANTLKTIRKLINEGIVFGNETQYRHSQNGQMYPEFHLDYRNTMVVVSGYSAQLRAAIIDRWQELERSHQQQDPALILAHKVIEQAAQIERLEKTKAQINDKRTATLMNKASQDAKRIKRLESQLQDVGEYQSIVAAKLPQRIDTEVRNNVQSWRILKEISSDRQLPPKKVKCQRYGEVLAYHIDVIEIFKDKYM